MFPPQHRNEKFPQMYSTWIKKSGGKPLTNGNTVDNPSSLASMMKDYLTAKTLALVLGSTSSNELAPVIASIGGNVPNNIVNHSTKRRVITFRCDDDISSSDSIPIDGIELKGTSTMLEALTFSDGGCPSFSEDNNLQVQDPNAVVLSFHVKVDSGSDDFIFKKWRFLKMKVDALHSLVNVK